MGIFFERAATSTNLESVIADALRTDPQTVDDPHAEAADRAATVEVGPPGYARFNRGRFFGALVLFSAIVIAAIATDATGVHDSSKALWGLAATVFGVVVGFLGGEKSAT